MTESALPSVVQIITGSGSGTGFIASEDGLVVTNKHVVEGERRVTIRLATGEEYRGIVIKRNPVLDLAYVEIDSTKTFTPLPLGDSGAVRVGEPVIAIGYPLSEKLGLDPTVSLGIISAKRDDYLQTDASLNPGNSGGPLLDANGKVIGVITARVESTETGRPVTGIGFAIPISEVRQDLEWSATSGGASPKPTTTLLPTIPPTPDIEATKAAIEAMDAHRRQAEQATRAATEAQQEAERYSASLEATRVAELPKPTAAPTPNLEATKATIEAMDVQQRVSELATRTAAETRQEADRYAASLEATRVAELPTPTPAPEPTPFPTATLLPTVTPSPVPTPMPVAIPQAIGRDYFTRRSSQDEVLHVQGTPTAINSYNALGKETWNYDWSTVTFSLPDGLVIEWRNTGNLKVRLLPENYATPTPEHFTRGSFQDEVLHVQGTPTAINTYNALGKETWNYDWSTVTLSLPDGLVIEWRNTGNLKVRLLPENDATSTPEHFTHGSFQDEVLHVQGTPTAINTYNALGKETWNYDWSTVTFSLPDGLVIEWRNTGNLKVK